LAACRSHESWRPASFGAACGASARHSFSKCVHSRPGCTVSSLSQSINRTSDRRCGMAHTPPFADGQSNRRDTLSHRSTPYGCPSVKIVGRKPQIRAKRPHAAETFETCRPGSARRVGHLADHMVRITGVLAKALKPKRERPAATAFAPKLSEACLAEWTDSRVTAPARCAARQGRATDLWQNTRRDKSPTRRLDDKSRVRPSHSGRGRGSDRARSAIRPPTDGR
jgi:hypothetical protein